MIRSLPWATYAILTLFAGPAAWAAPDGELLAKRLADHAPQCGHFEQTRWLADLEARLNSRGYFVREKRALVWQTTAPVRDRVILSEQGEDLSLGLQVIAPTLSGLLAGNWQALERHFTIGLSGTQEEWQARLTPREARVAERLTQLLVHGNLQVERIELEFANDDRLDLSLTAATCAALEKSEHSDNEHSENDVRSP